MTLSVKGRSEKFGSATVALDPTCHFCGSRKEVAGPIWNGPLHDVGFVGEVLEVLKDEQIACKLGTTARIQGLLSVIAEVYELVFDPC